MYSVIDIGSNTIRLTVYQVDEGEIKIVFQTKDLTGLAGYVTEKGALSEEGIRKAGNVLLQFRLILDRLGIHHRAVLATASLRNITNTDEAAEKLEQASGLTIQVISGKQEALLGYYGATYRMPMEQGLIVDIGGGSTELVFVQDSIIQKAVSMPIGSLNMFEKKVKKLFPTKTEQEKICNRVRKELAKAGVPEGTWPLACGVGGTIRGTGKLAASVFTLPPGSQSITKQMVDDLLEQYAELSRDSLRSILRTVPERIHTILPGMLILSTILHALGCKNVDISQYGIREGYLLSEVLQERSPGGYGETHSELYAKP